MKPPAAPITSMLAYQSVTTLTEQFRLGALSPVAVLKEQLARIATYNGAINAFTHVNEAGAMNAAIESEKRWSKGEPLSALDGITFTAKDNFMVAGFPYRRGSLATSSEAVAETSPIVARLQEGGAILVGLTTMPEFGAGATTNSPLTGITRNPWDLSKHAGGSSGGAAAGIAAGFSTVALGSDAGGSLRIPASLCGVIGFKPTGASVPVYPSSFVGSVSCPGPLVRNIDDARAVMSLAVAPDSRDPFAAVGTYGERSAAQTKGLRVAYSLDMGYAPHVDADVSVAIEKAVQLFASLGAVVSNANPGTGSPLDTFATLTRANYRHTLPELGERTQLLGPTLRAMLGDEADVSLERYLQVQDEIFLLAQKLQSFHERFDLLITPTVAHPAFDAERSFPQAYEKFPNPRAWSPFTSLFNLTQQPAISVPAGFTKDGLPIGMQIVGARGADMQVLAAAAAYLDLSETSGIPALR